jgi:hypothetical protein
MQEKTFFDLNEERIQSWLIGYKVKNVWKTLEIPAHVKRKTVEQILYDLNENFDIVVSRKIDGAIEKTRKAIPKGDFLGL